MGNGQSISLSMLVAIYFKIFLISNCFFLAQNVFKAKIGILTVEYILRVLPPITQIQMSEGGTIKKSFKFIENYPSQLAGCVNQTFEGKLSVTRYLNFCSNDI